MAHKLQNYLRTYRKRTGLSQGEMAAILGCRDEHKLIRYERFARLPELPTVFACEAFFNIPSRELFAGIYDQAQSDHDAARQCALPEAQRGTPDKAYPAEARSARKDH